MSAPGEAQIARTSSVVRQSTKSVSGWVTIVRASVPTRTSTNSMPFSRQSSASVSLIGREALEMSVSPAPQKRSKPPPVPEREMLTVTLGWTCPNSSSIASVSGATVDDPSMTIAFSSGALPQATESRATLPRTAAHAWTFTPAP